MGDRTSKRNRRGTMGGVRRLPERNVVAAIVRIGLMLFAAATLIRPAQARQAVEQPVEEPVDELRIRPPAGSAFRPDSARAAVVRAEVADYAVMRTGSNWPESLVFVNDELLGRADQGPYEVEPGQTEIRFSAPFVTAWAIVPRDTTMRVAAGDTVDAILDFPYYYKVDSEPFGARVFVGEQAAGRLLGQTPMFFVSEQRLPGPLRLERSGYGTGVVPVDDRVWNYAFVELPRVGDGADSPALVQVGRRHRRWIDVAALGVSAAAGVAAVHYKFRADRRYDRYLETGDPGLRPGVKRMDVASGVALGVMQGGLTLFTLRLVLR